MRRQGKRAPVGRRSRTRPPDLPGAAPPRCGVPDALAVIGKLAQ